MYESGIASQSCVYKDKKWVGLPITIDFSVLYSNPVFLKKYNITIPKTWDGLLNTCKYVMEKERSKGNKNIIVYNGLFNSYEVGTCSLYEYIFSYRNSSDAPFPEITSNEAIEALKMMKKMKEELNAESIFRSSDDISLTQLLNEKKGNFLFIKYWYLSSITGLNITALPGRVEGVSGSAIGGPNLGISTYIDDRKLKSALIALQYITSKKIQKDLIINNQLFSGISDLYDDPEVCAAINCSLLKSVQLTARPTNKTKDYNGYSEKFRNYIYEYLYGDKSPKEVLKNIDDITRFYHLPISNESTPIGTIIFVTFIFLSIIMLLSLTFLIIDKYKPFFIFLSNDLWIFIIIGSILTMSTCLTVLGEMTTLKCQLQVLLLSVGFTLSIIPVFYKLIVNFPERNDISQFINKKKYLFIFLFLLYDILLNSLPFDSAFILDEKLVDHGQNFKMCRITKYGKLLLGLLLAIKISTIICILFFIFVEWNIENIRSDIRFLSAAIYMDIVSIGVLLLASFIDINNYIVFYSIPAFIFILFALTNYSLLYAYRIFKAHNMENNNNLYTDSFEKNNSSNDNIYYYNSTGKLSSFPNNNINYFGNSSDISMPNDMLNYHYRKNNNVLFRLSSSYTNIQPEYNQSQNMLTNNFV
ncbi:periplasmic binding protein-like II [Piromyces finnis]|uniref:Periplasmic binding protein-like II n=1 Tax=Piromyces finnis TaxID=1754191 RepID=A0A1Y1V935_9FUNG|nr:periplasmic binding protein-like II [Piromyces finnis]|eukprot:ORX50297.1 periplasmic binding protein-like II [Piromyces finnis]